MNILVVSAPQCDYTVISRHFVRQHTYVSAGHGSKIAVINFANIGTCWCELALMGVWRSVSLEVMVNYMHSPLVD